ncbi:MAG TPA: TldD/PmbA family protein, partial [Chloroflexota bacterium]|nr:TldD/PmbA family protein [Chloroflexota bacterium]
MKDIAERALNQAQVAGASYADVRVVSQRSEVISVKNGKVEALTRGSSQGFGVRVIAGGAWGFASSNQLTTGEADRVAALAVAIARASALAKKGDVQLSAVRPAQAKYATPVDQDPLEVSLEDKLALLMGCDEAMRRAKGLSVAESSLEAAVEDKLFASTEGSFIEQRIVTCGGGIEATAVTADEVQTRSYPNSFGRQAGTAGWEFIENLQLAENAERIASEAVELLSTKQCPSTTTTLILDGTQLALQVHESCGHPIELDRVMGMEAAYAGTSFLTTDKLGHFRYGSELVNIVADATAPRGLGTFGYDDEGVPGQRTPIVREGVFVGYMSSRETAPLIGQTSSGTMRADGWNRIPLIRMTNVNLKPGTWTLDDLIADTDDGIMMAVNSSWSIDDKRLNFQFGTELAWEIKAGKKGALLKNATYTGITPDFWGSCDAICDANHWQLWGTTNCGKGQPGQTMYVGHGVAPARFRNVRVGIV